MVRFDDIRRRTVNVRLVRGVLTLLLAFLLALSAALPNPGIGASSLSHPEPSVSPRGAVAPAPVLVERHDRPPAPSSRENSFTVSPEVVGVAPETHGAVIVTVRDDTPLDALFVYTQTTSSRL
jgi:hypothetical protein